MNYWLYDFIDEAIGDCGGAEVLGTLVEHLCEDPQWTRAMMASSDKQRLIDLVEEYLIMEHV